MKLKKLRITLSDYVRAAKRADRTAEIQEHGRPVSFKRVHKSRKVYDRKRLKAGDKKNLPSFIDFRMLYAKTPFYSILLSNMPSLTTK